MEGNIIAYVRLPLSRARPVLWLAYRSHAWPVAIRTVTIHSLARAAGPVDRDRSDEDIAVDHPMPTTGRASTPTLGAVADSAQSRDSADHLSAAVTTACSKVKAADRGGPDT